MIDFQRFTSPCPGLVKPRGQVGSPFEAVEVKRT
jgi:hypothetical protein